MTKSIGRLLRDLTGRSEHVLVGHLERQVDAALRGAGLAKRAIREGMPTSELRDRMSQVENEGDASRGHLVEELTRSLTTPVDREDLFRLSRSIDDVLDHLRDFARELNLYDVEDGHPFLPLLDALISGLRELRIAVSSIAEDPARTSRLCLAAKKSGNQVRRMYQQGMAHMFAGEFGMEARKQAELLRRLDVAGLLLSQAADSLADGAMKRTR